jgi:hypothetical protein
LFSVQSVKETYEKLKIPNKIPVHILSFKDDENEDEIRKYQDLFKVKVTSNNMEKVNAELLKAHRADI